MYMNQQRTSNKMMQKEYQPICHQSRMARDSTGVVEILLRRIWKVKQSKNTKKGIRLQ